MAPLEENFTQLVNAGLLRYDAEGNVRGVESWEEHQHLKQQREADALSASTLRQQMELQPAYVASSERMRPSQQLEPNEGMIQGSSLTDAVRSDAFQDANGDDNEYAD